MNDTTFDPERFKLPPEVVAELAKAKPKRHGKRPKRTEPFLQIPHKAIVAGRQCARQLRTVASLAVYSPPCVGRQSCHCSYSEQGP